MVATQTAPGSVIPLHYSASGVSGLSTTAMHRPVLDDSATPAFWRSSSSSSSSLASSSTSTSSELWNSGGVVAVMVLGGLCLVLGVVYAYIYFTRINPRAANRAARKYVSRPPPPAEDSVQLPTSTHLFLFKKS